MDTEALVIDEFLPAYDVTIAVHRIVAADPGVTWGVARHLDFMTVHTPLLDTAMWVRGLPARLRGRPMPRPERLVLAGTEALPGWLTLGEREGVEIAFGAVGTFWRGEIEWRDVARDDFAAFAEPGYGKIACNFTIRPYGQRRTLLTYECRTATTDPVTRRRFGRYWMVVRPFVAHIMRATVAEIGTAAARRATVAGPVDTG